MSEINVLIAYYSHECSVKKINVWYKLLLYLSTVKNDSFNLICFADLEPCALSVTSDPVLDCFLLN